MGLSQIVCMLVFFGIAMGYATRAKWMPAVLGKVPGGSRFQSDIGRKAGVEMATLEGEISLGQPTNFFNVLAQTRANQQWEKRYWLLDNLGSKIQEGFLLAWAQSMPDAPGIQLAIGFVKIKQAWEARGHGKASTVSDDEHATMHQRGIEAAHAFRRAAATDPADPTPWIGLIDAERCIQDDDIKNRTRPLFAEVMKRDPESYFGIYGFAQVFAPYWWGEDGEFLEEARRLAHGAPGGSRRASAIITAHFNEWHNRNAFKSKDEARAYITRPDVIAELRNAYAASIGNPAARPQEGSPGLNNLAAFMMYMAGQKDIVRHELARIGDRWTDVWWTDDVKGPQAGYEKAKAWAASA